MFDKHKWNTAPGTGEPESLTLLALSSCGFCKSARKYLEDRGLAYRYLELDLLKPEEKAEIKEEFKTKFGRRPTFPSLIIDDKQFLIGFIKAHWDEEVRPEDLRA